MVLKVDGNLQLDSGDWSMYSNILKYLSSEILGIYKIILMLSAHDMFSEGVMVTNLKRTEILDEV